MCEAGARAHDGAGWWCGVAACRRWQCREAPKPVPARAMACWILTGDARAMEMEVTMVGLQNAGKTSLLRVLAVGFPLLAK